MLMKILIKILALSLLGLGVFMVNVYLPQNDSSIKVGFIVGVILLFVGIIRVFSVFRNRRS